MMLRMQKEKTISSVSNYLCLSGFFILLVITILNPNPPIFDEVLFLPNVLLFEEHGLSKQFLLELYDQAPGPLYQFIHYPLKSLTQLTTPGIRLVNIVLLAFATLILIIFVRKWMPARIKANHYFPLMIIAVPMIWQVAGMALTEIPAIFTASLFMLSFVMMIKKEDHQIYQIVFSILSGLFLGLTILGRSPYLMILPGLLIPFLMVNNKFKKGMIVIIGLIAAGISFPVFIIWNGLVPPAQAHVGVGGIVIRNGILAFSYMFLVVLLLAPKWYEFKRKDYSRISIAFILAFIINIAWLKSDYAPLSEFLGIFFPPGFIELYKLIINPILIVMGLYFLYNSYNKVLQNKNNTIYIFLLISTILILATCFKVTHLFSSRYVAQAIPFILPVILLSDSNDKSKPLRIILGFIIGFISLNTYNPLF